MNEKIIENLLLQEGVKKNCYGFEYIAEAIEYVDACLKQSPRTPLMRDIYCFLANEHSITKYSIRRAMEYANLPTDKTLKNLILKIVYFVREEPENEYV